jgi:putative ABC transport system permease protein
VLFLFHDLRYAVRTLGRSPGFTTVAVLTLALGIGANTAIFSIVNTVVLRPLPYADATRLVVIGDSDRQWAEGPISYPDFLDWQAQNQIFEHMAAFQGEGINLLSAARPESLSILKVSADFFRTLGVRPIHGRDFLDSEDKAGSIPVAVMSHRLWQARFGGDPGVIGSRLTLKGTLKARSYTVIGVLPSDFRFAGEADLFLPIGLWSDDGYLMKRENHDRTLAVARLKAETTLGQARAQMETISHRLSQQYPASNTGFRATVTPLRERATTHARPVLLVLLCAVGVVLLIACVNIANLLLARSLAREKEVAIRVALGASRGRVIRQFLTESVLLGLLGGAAGLALGVWVSGGLTRLIPQDLPLRGVAVDYRVLGFTLLISLLTGVVFGLAPALQSGRLDLNASLKEGGRSSSPGSGHYRIRSVLVVSEVALALVLLISAGLMVQSLRQLLKVDLGFDPTGVLTIGLDMSDAKYDQNPAHFMAFNAQLLESIRTLPGVRYAGLVRPLPLVGGRSSMWFYRDGLPVPSSDACPSADWRVASPGYFQAMRISLLKGRFFEDADRLETPPVTVINETMARSFWPGEDPVGKRMRLGKPDMGLPWFTIVGVVHDTRPFGLEAAVPAEFFVSCLQLGSWVDMSLVVRTASNPPDMAGALRERVAALDREMVTSNIRSMEERLSATMADRRSTTFTFSIFAALALTLAGVGIYGVMSYSVAQRRHEIGVRLALGATRRDVLMLAVGHGLVMTLAGVFVGLIGACVLTRALSSMLYGVPPTDPVTFVCVTALLVGVALLACYIPAHRATKVDAMVALHYE